MEYYFYITPNNSPVDIFDDVSFIHIYIEDNVMTILFLKSVVKGQGTILLRFILNYAYNLVDKIVLDDDSDMYRSPNNIYVKHGFRYVEDWGPEMEVIPYRILIRSRYPVIILKKII